MRPQADPDTIAILGAGVIGCSVAWALAREGRRVLLIDPEEPGRGGASFGNVGHIAAELIEPLPSPQLLYGFWPLLETLGGPLHIPLRRLPRFAPWACRFAAAAFRRERNTRALAPLVRPAATAYANVLGEIGRSDLLKRNGHYDFWFGPKSHARARAEALHMERLGIATAAVRPDVLEAVASAPLGGDSATTAGLWFPETAHVTDPHQICLALAGAAYEKGTKFWRTRVGDMLPRGSGIELHTSEGAITVDTAVVCAGVWSAPLLASFGLNAPLEAAHGYHVDMPGHGTPVDASITYVDRKIVVTPLAGRVRASTFMEFTGIGASPDPAKPVRLRRELQRLGYRCDDDGPSWMGARPVLPDYLPGIGRAGHHRVFYAVGHQHIGLTLAPVTGTLIADLVVGRTPRHDIAPFDLRRFGTTSSQ